MTKAWRFAAVLLLGLPVDSRAAPAISAPLDGGVEAGGQAGVEISGCLGGDARFTARIDGAAVTARWNSEPYSGRYFARIPLAGEGAHRLEVAATCDGSTTRLAAGFTSFGAAGSSLALASQLAAHFMATYTTASLGWDWGPGVLMVGLARLGDARSLSYVDAYYDAWAVKGPPAPVDSDGCGPALGALAAFEKGDALALAAALPAVNYLRTEPRDSLGALDHLGHSFASHLFPESIWVDSLMMTSVLAARWGATRGDPALLAFGAAQPAIYASVLQDAASGLFWHAWNLSGKKTIPDSPAFWLRGNGWVAVSIVEMLDTLAPAAPEREKLLGILARQAQGLAATQLDSGLWDTLANRPGFAYAEASGSALVAYAWARAAHRGWLAPVYLSRARRAFDGVSALLAPAPGGLSMTAISGPTDPGPDYAYAFINPGVDYPYGVGAYLLAASELARDPL